MLVELYKSTDAPNQLTETTAASIQIFDKYIKDDEVSTRFAAARGGTN